MAVDTNFERLEQEVNRLVEVLERLRGENASKDQEIRSLRSANGDLETAIAQLKAAQVESENMLKTRDEMKSRIEEILAKLDAVEL
jgi:chromosome segregation ATPase